ncbi:MAG: L-histidine N(alpha)-methyltransferase [Candidatus Magasanikbacteria bacterium]
MSNQSLFSKRQQSELITAIKGRGEIPLKFAYLGEGSENWDEIASERKESGGINSIESNLLKRKVRHFTSAFQEKEKLNVIDIGCGNGQPIIPVIEKLRKEGFECSYVPIDISEELLELASKNVKEEFPDININTFQFDFELGNFSDITYPLKQDNSSNLLFFLGSTLGNHSDINRVLTNFRDSITSDDFLVLGVELTNVSKSRKILKQYKSKPNKDFVYFIPNKIGIDRNSTEFEIKWNERDRQVEVRLILKNDVEVSIGSEKFSLEKNESILVGRSVKFTEGSITNLLSNIGLRNELLTTNRNRSYLLSMVQPTRYSI